MCGCACGCGPKNWGVDAFAAHYENVCDVRAGADENPRTLKVCPIYYEKTTKLKKQLFG